MFNKLIDKLNTRSIVVLVLLFGASIIAIKDPTFRPVYGNLCSTAIGGYLGLTYPRKRKDNEDIDSR